MQKSIIFAVLILLYSSPNIISQDIKIKNGVKYIHNKKPQWGKKPKVKLEFIQEIGGIDVEDKKYVMSEIRDVFRDKNNNIFAALGMGCVIKKFDENGKFIKNIGKKGQGPGEFNGSSGIDIDDESNMYVLNPFSNMISVLNSEGKELKRFFFKRASESIRLLSNKSIIIKTTTTTAFGPDSPPVFFVYDLNGYLLYTMGKVTVIKPKGQQKSFIISTGLRFETDKSDFIYCTYEYQNRIEKWDEKGTVIFSADRPLRYKIEPEHRSIGRGQTVKFSNIVSKGIGIDHNERIWVTTYFKQFGPVRREGDNLLFARKGTRKEHAQFEIYDKDGILLGYLPQPCDIFYWRMFGDRLYIVDENRISVKEYKIVDME